MTLIAKADLSTGNSCCSSYVLQSNDIKFVVTAPQSLANVQASAQAAIPGYDPTLAYAFVQKHGLAVRAVGVLTLLCAQTTT
jgi:4-hydroxyphenylpyruvate dioxygenase